jgi:predicted RNA binding protein YcfA (HicA-like mRNA interferase family)
MKIPRNLKGSTLVRVFCKCWGYTVVNQEGSHIILVTDIPSYHRICIPNHNPLRIGTLNSIVSAVARHKGVTKQEILDSLL